MDFINFSLGTKFRLNRFWIRIELHFKSIYNLVYLLEFDLRLCSGQVCCEWVFKISKQIFVTFFFLLKKHLTRKFHHWLESWFNFPFKKGHTFYQIKCDILGRELWPGTHTFRFSSILLACLGLHWPACLVCLGRLVCFVQSALACPLSSWGRAMYPCALMLIRP